MSKSTKQVTREQVLAKVRNAKSPAQRTKGRILNGKNKGKGKDSVSPGKPLEMLKRIPMQYYDVEGKLHVEPRRTKMTCPAIDLPVLNALIDSPRKCNQMQGIGDKYRAKPGAAVKPLLKAVIKVLPKKLVLVAGDKAVVKRPQFGVKVTGPSGKLYRITADGENVSWRPTAA